MICPESRRVDGCMGGSIVHDIDCILDRIHDRAGLGGQVDLEANIIAGLRDGQGQRGMTVRQLIKASLVLQ